jgi:tetratricopeptide (TPR) repeat protein
MVADRYSYLSCLGWTLIAGAGAGRCASVWMVGARHRRKAAAGLVAMALAAVLLVALSARQCLVWQDSVTLWSHALALDPDNARAAVALGATRLFQGENSEARRLFERSVRLDPLLAEGLMGLAVSWSLEGEGRQALPFAERAVARRPLDAGLRHFHGAVLRAAGLQEAALAAFAEASRLSPVEPGPRYATATLLAELGRHDEAARALAEARRVARALDPDDPEADRFEALVYTQSDPARAEQAWRRYLDRLLLASDVTPLVLGRRRAAAAALQALETAPRSAPAAR